MENENQNIENIENQEVKPKFDKQAYNKKYNKDYYEKNREKLLQRALEKLECQKCKRIVNRGRMSTHLGSKICVNTYNRNKYINEV